MTNTLKRPRTTRPRDMETSCGRQRSSSKDVCRAQKVSSARTVGSAYKSATWGCNDATRARRLDCECRLVDARVARAISVSRARARELLLEPGREIVCGARDPGAESPARGGPVGGAPPAW